jgi:hypothetical protein
VALWAAARLSQSDLAIVPTPRITLRPLQQPCQGALQDPKNDHTVRASVRAMIKPTMRLRVLERGGSSNTASSKDAGAVGARKRCRAGCLTTWWRRNRKLVIFAGMVPKLGVHVESWKKRECLAKLPGDVGSTAAGCL